MAQTAIERILSGSSGIPAQLFAAVISTSDDAIVVKSLDGMISTWNQGAMRMYGYTPDEAIGQPITMLCPPDRNGEIADILVKIRAGERISHYETVVAIQPESGLHCGRARLPADVGCARRRVRVAGAAVRRGAMGARLRAGARGRR